MLKTAGKVDNTFAQALLNVLRVSRATLKRSLRFPFGAMQCQVAPIIECG